MIDIKTGDIKLDNGLIIPARMKHNDFLKSSLLNLVEKDTSHVNYAVYRLKPQIIENKSFTFNIYFENNKELIFVRLVTAIPTK